ncbi:hypothetical protein [Mesorhizobium sp. M0018]|uniref:hypothetical protein n=1 Tax=Mesorhizobium sp. M0018 TaxID=2956844 RepID=UPI00333BCB20
MRVHYEHPEWTLRPYYICNEAVLRHAAHCYSKPWRQPQSKSHWPCKRRSRC